MKLHSVLQQELTRGALDARLHQVCGGGSDTVESERRRLSILLDAYAAAFPGDEPVGLYSAPGRTELGGNHTDHQRGRVLAAAVNLSALACAAPTRDRVVEIRSEGYPTIRVDLDRMEPVAGEEGTSAALVRGIAARIAQLGYAPGGFRAVMSSTVLGGSGLSSSAAYEVLVGVIFNDLYCAGCLSPVAIAQIGQYAENVFFGKPCGLMDQLACSVGGVVSVDFEEPQVPVVEQVSCDPTAYGYALCIIDSGADHADLTQDYADIPLEMQAVAAHFGKSVLREVKEEDFWRELPAIRRKTGDRSLLRAIHFFHENELVPRQAKALRKQDFPEFLTLVRRSGASSARHLQNLSCTGHPAEQAVPLALALAEHLLHGRGAARVHGGGFAGTIQAYVPLDTRDSFRAGMEALLGEGCCHFLNFRPVGGAVLA